jgi:membrane associated rhomboid family serine protease
MESSDREKYSHYHDGHSSNDDNDSRNTRIYTQLDDAAIIRPPSTGISCQSSASEISDRRGRSDSEDYSQSVSTYHDIDGLQEAQLQKRERQRTEQRKEHLEQQLEHLQQQRKVHESSKLRYSDYDPSRYHNDIQHYRKERQLEQTLRRDDTGSQRQPSKRQGLRLPSRSQQRQPSSGRIKNKAKQGEGDYYLHQQQSREQHLLSNDTSGSDGEDDEVYIVKQRYGYCSIFFSLIQCIVLGLMMWQCGVAPFRLNPMIGPYPDAFSEWGGKNSVLILEDGEWYRLITPIFLHAGIIHLLGNIMVQLETGAFFETEWGSIRWLILYLGSAVGSTIGSTVFMPMAISVGSSGAVMGLFGGKLCEVFLRVCERRARTSQEKIAEEVRSEQCCAVSCSVIVVLLFSFIPFVDWAAHAFGLLSGFVIGIPVFACDIRSNICWRIVWFIVGVLLTVLMFAISIVYMYTPGTIELIDELHDVCGYYQQVEADSECNCMRDEYNFYNNLRSHMNNSNN